jgi:hypothetical protein
MQLTTCACVSIVIASDLGGFLSASFSFLCVHLQCTSSAGATYLQTCRGPQQTLLLVKTAVRQASSSDAIGPSLLCVFLYAKLRTTKFWSRQKMQHMKYCTVAPFFFPHINCTVNNANWSTQCPLRDANLAFGQLICPIWHLSQPIGKDKCRPNYIFLFFHWLMEASLQLCDRASKE